MKQYYTLIQDFQPKERSLESYLDDQGIKYDLGADYAEDLMKVGLVRMRNDYGILMKKYTVLIEEHELSAIRLSVEGVMVVENRTGVKLQNKIRSYFSWILD